MQKQIEFCTIAKQPPFPFPLSSPSPFFPPSRTLPPIIPQPLRSPYPFPKI